MARHRIDLNGFKRDKDFYGKIPLTITIKSFELQEIRKRYLASRKRKDGVTGSVERREPSLGGIAAMELSNGGITKTEILKEMREPRGIALKNGELAISSDKVVYLIRENGMSSIQDPWFSYIHTLDFQPETNRLLVSSSGLDCIFLVDPDSGEKEYEWFAWENGFPISKQRSDDGGSIFLTRDPEEAKRIKGTGKEVRLITDPQKDHLPTAQRSAFINSALFSDRNKVLLTFFHLGEVKQLDLETGDLSDMISDLKNPHGGRVFENSVMATSTGEGLVSKLEKGVRTDFDFSSLPGKPDELRDSEWIQNSATYQDLIISIDSNRNSFVVFDPVKELIDLIPFDENWALQDLVLGAPGETIADIIRSSE